MNFLKTCLHSVLLLTLMMISGCSDLFQKDVVKKSLESNKFKANCELNVDDFSLIMEENISGSIDCLHKNLKLFMDVAESKKPGYLSRVGFENYLKRNRKDIKPDVIRAIRSVFDINFLVYGEDKDFISRQNVDALIKFVKTFNEKASANFNPIFMDENTIDYDNYRFQRDQRIKPAALVISNALKEIFKPDRKGEIHSLDINNLLDSFTNEENEDSMADAKKVLFVKKILLGGEKDTITHLELSRLIDNFSSYVLIALDGMRYKDIRLNQESTVELLNTDLELLNSLIFSSTMPGRSNSADLENEKFFTLHEAIDAVNLFLDDEDDLDLDKYYDLLKEAKLMVMEGTDAETVTAADFRRLFAHGMTLLKTGTFFHRFWSTERVLLEARPGRPITYDFKNLYDLFKSEKPRVDDFVRILKKYRFMKGENISAYYTDDYMRNPNAVFEIAIYEYAMKLVMKKFGCPNNTLGGTVVCDTAPSADHTYMGKDYVYMKVEHVINLVQKFRKVLIDNDLLLPGREKKIAETITLLGSLFQYQSDENKVFDVNEGTEFAISLFTAIEASDELNTHFETLTSQKKCDMDKFGRVSPQCFEDHFYEGVCLNYPDQFPKLFASLGATIYETDPVRGTKKLVCKIPKDVPNLAYLDRAVRAARICNVYPGTDEKIYFNKGDIMSVLLAMMHIETTILRWDTRVHNNLMDAPEVMDAYSIYSPALDGFLEKMPGIVKGFKKQIFQYLVKYETVPDPKNFSSIWKFVKFLVSFNKQADANRKTIASILVTIGDQGAPSLFDCSLLRDPDNIPEDYDPNNTGGSTSTASTAAPMKLSVEDAKIAGDINGENDGIVEWFMKLHWPDFLKF